MTMLHTRYATWHSSPLVLIPWQLMTAAIPLTLLAITFESTNQIHWNATSIPTVLYNAFIATGFAYWGIIYVGRRMPVVSISLWLLAVPVVGLISSAIILHEALTPSILVAMALIITGLACVALGNKTSHKDEIALKTCS